jgi:hypothetical protein
MSLSSDFKTLSPADGWTLRTVCIVLVVVVLIVGASLVGLHYLVKVDGCADYGGGQGYLSPPACSTTNNGGD